MKQIPLTRGHVALVDDEDYETLAQHKWCALVRSNRPQSAVYAVRAIPREGGGQRMVYMHRVIAGTRDGECTDHINGNTIDNRKLNLRTCTKAENRCNVGKHFDNTSGYKGVVKIGKKWKAQLQVNGHMMYLGTYLSADEAAAAYDRAALKHHGAFARLNTCA